MRPGYDDEIYREYLKKLTEELSDDFWLDKPFTGMEYKMPPREENLESEQQSVVKRFLGWLNYHSEDIKALLLIVVVVLVIALVIYNYAYCRITFGGTPIVEIPSYCVSSFQGYGGQ